MKVLQLVLLISVALGACKQAPKDDNPLTDAEREIAVDALLSPLAERLVLDIGDKRAGVAPFDKEGQDYEPRVSRYITPRLIDQLEAADVKVHERRDLDAVVRELKLQLSDMVDEDTRVEMGNISGVDLLVIGTVKDQSLSVYRIAVKLIDVKTAEILMAEFVDLPRELLPVAYGGL